MYYYVIVENYSKQKLERTFVLNPKFNQYEIKKQMRKEGCDIYLIFEVQRKGVFLNQDISFVVDEKMEIYWKVWQEGHLMAIREQKFAHKDKLTFHVDGSYSWKTHAISNKVKALLSGKKNRGFLGEIKEEENRTMG